MARADYTNAKEENDLKDLTTLTSRAAEMSFDDGSSVLLHPEGNNLPNRICERAGQVLRRE